MFGSVCVKEAGYRSGSGLVAQPARQGITASNGVCTRCFQIGDGLLNEVVVYREQLRELVYWETRKLIGRSGYPYSLSPYCVASMSNGSWEVRESNSRSV